MLNINWQFWIATNLLSVKKKQIICKAQGNEVCLFLFHVPLFQNVLALTKQMLKFQVYDNHISQQIPLRTSVEGEGLAVRRHPAAKGAEQLQLS